MVLDGDASGQGEKETNKEIERKFLVKELPPDLYSFEHTEIKQGYLEIGENREVRVRQAGEMFFRTEKIGNGLERIENEEEISREDFEELWQQTEGMRVEKTRYKIPINGGAIELDIYHGDLDGHMVAEIELKTSDNEVDLVGKEWLGQEVTGNSAFSNAELAQHGWPEAEKETPRFELKEGVNNLIEMAKEKLNDGNGPIIIQIAGGSASGKTSAVSSKVKEAFGEDAIIISMDDYYRGRRYMEEQARQGNQLNFDQPEVLNLDELRENLGKLRAGEGIDEPIYSFVSGEREGTRRILPARIIVVEGLFALDDSLVAEGDIHAFVDIGTHGRIIRRLLRDVERTGQNPKDILEYFADVVEPMHEKYVQSTIKNADIVISNEYSPDVEAERSGRSESQLKFPASDIDSETLRRLGAEVLGHSHQRDRYYNPNDRDLSETGESLRIREESGKFTLGYKGPDKGGEFRNRSKFEFEIDQATGDKLLSMYGETRIVDKERTIYQLDGVIFSVDHVQVLDDGERDLGRFVEIRGNERVGQNLDAVISKLGLEISQGTKTSYSEM